MKIKSTVVAAFLCAAVFAGCSTGRYPRLAYQESQFDSRLEYLRFCQRYEMRTGRCV